MSGSSIAVSNDVAIVRCIDFDPWFEDVNVTGTETGLTETIADLVKFDLVFIRRVALMSQFLLAVGCANTRSLCVLTGTATENSFSSLNHMNLWSG